jgi:hypothetical protein
LTIPETGEVRQAQRLVAVLGASNYTFADVTWTQNLPDWIGSHLRAFEFFQGVPEIVVPDNLKSGVTRSCRYEPGVNITYEEMAGHYGVAVVPARPYKPRDKAKVEVGVQIAQRWILAALRKQTFFSLGEASRAVAPLLTRLNERAFRRREGSRKSLFDQVERPALRALPVERFQYGDWKAACVNIDYHVEFDRHWYSVPYELTRRQVEIRATDTTVETPQKAFAWPPMCVRTASTSTRPRPNTGPKRINGLSNGRRRESRSGPPRWALQRTGGRQNPDDKQASGTGISFLPRHHSAGQEVRRRASGKGRHARSVAQCMQLPEYPLNAREQTPSAGSTRAGNATSGDAADSP